MRDEHEVSTPALRRGRRNPENLRAWESQFAEDTRLVYDSRSRVAMTAQSSVIKDLLSSAIESFKIDLAFERPITDIKERYARQRKMLLDCANALTRPNIVSRLKKDDTYVRDLIAVVRIFSITFQFVRHTYQRCIKYIARASYYKASRRFQENSRAVD